MPSPSVTPAAARQQPPPVPPGAILLRMVDTTARMEAEMKRAAEVAAKAAEAHKQALLVQEGYFLQSFTRTTHHNTACGTRFIARRLVYGLLNTFWVQARFLDKYDVV